jgi:hypothetical protein
MKIRPVGAAMFHADRRTDREDMTKLIVAFRNFANAHKNDAHPYLRFTLDRKYFKSANHSGQLRSNVFTWNTHCDTQVTALLVMRDVTLIDTPP